MNKITTHLWFDTQAGEAAEFYVSAFRNAKINGKYVLNNTPSGSVDVVDMTIEDHDFTLISAGPYFKINPSISFFVNFDPSQDKDAKAHLDELWTKLSPGGQALMPLQKYPFSEWYGWIQDKYGVSWQLILTNPKGEPRPMIVPSLLFTKAGVGKADEAIDFWVSVFKNSKRGTTARYPKGMEPDKEGNVMFADFMLGNQWFAAMESAQPHAFAFNEGVSLMVHCKDQEEIDYYWEKLSAVPESDLPAPRPDTFYVYVLLCGDGSMYIGQTQDIKKRWREHESGAGAEYTKNFKPTQVIHYEEFPTRQAAVDREQKLKTGFGRKWLKREWKAGRTRQAGQCGWLKDKYGVSWQIVPDAMDEMMAKGTPDQIGRVTQAFLKMKKFDLAELKKVYEGE